MARVSSIGASGGLLSLWKDDFFSVDETIKGNHFLLLRGTIIECNFEYVLCNIYAPNLDSERRVFWEEMIELKRGFNLPWCFAGDFNVVKEESERSGGVFNAGPSMDFVNFIQSYSLVDLNLARRKFTWSNNREHQTWGRLDRFLILSDWMTKFPTLRQ